MAIEIGQLQKEQRHWQEFNFPARTPTEPLLGMIEEVGELAHVELKGIQKIRYTPEEVIAKKKDACADIIVFMVDFCTARRIDLAYEYERRYRSLLPDDIGSYTTELIKSIQSSLGRICDHDGINPGLVCMHLAKIIYHLELYASRHQFHLWDAVEETWNKVKQRNWQANPLDANKKVEGSI